MIQKIVVRRDFREHLPHFARSIGFARRTFGPGPCGHPVARLRHFTHAAPARLPPLAASCAGPAPACVSHALRKSWPFRFLPSGQNATCLLVFSYPNPSARSVSLESPAATPVTFPSFVQAK